MTFISYSIMMVLCKLEKPFRLTILSLFFFYTHQQKRKSAAVAQLSKRQKLTTIFSNKVSKKLILIFPPFFNLLIIQHFPRHLMRHFLLLQHFALIKTFISLMAISQSINVNQKALLLVLSSPLSKNLIMLTILMLLCIEINAKVWVLLSFVV